MAEKTKAKKAEAVDGKKEKALADAITQIEKQFGKGSVMKLGDRVAVDIDVIPTGSLTLDAALGIGGYPKGRIIEIYGPESSGKTTLTLHAIAEVQKQGGRAAFIDAEHAIDPVYAKNLGVNVDELILSQPDSGEQGLAIAEQTYVNVNIHQKENADKLKALAQLPDSCAASADCLQKQRTVFEQYNVFSPAMIDGIISRLRSYNDATLRKDIQDKPEEMLALVSKFFHCG